MTGRSVPEWVGKTPDAAIPPRVRLRVFERHGGVCALTGQKIRAGDEWDIDHEIALANGGEHREANLRPVLRAAHRRKTAADSAQKAKDARVRKKHLGIAKPRSPLPGGRASKWKRKVDGTIERRD